MTSAAFTPQNLIELPRPGAAIVNKAGTRALWPSSEFSFEAAGGKGRTERSISLVDLSKAVVDVEAAKPKAILEHLSSLEAVWLDDHTFLFLRPPGDDAAAQSSSERPHDHPVDVSDGKHKERLAKIAEQDEGAEVWAKDVDSGDEYKVGKLPTPIGDIKTALTGEHSAVLTFSATVYPDGDPYTVKEQDEKAQKEANGSDVRVYDSLFVRHWDDWKPTKGQLKQLHFVRLVRNADAATTPGSDGFERLEGSSNLSNSRQWSFVHEASGEGLREARPSIHSPLKGTKLECPVGPFGGASDYDLTDTHIVLHAKDPELNPAWHTRTQVYLVPLSPRSNSDAKPRCLTVGNQGACSNPTFSPDGDRVAWLEMREDGYEADRNRVMIYDIKAGTRHGVTEHWDRSPASVTWCPCNEKVYLVAEDVGRAKLFQLSVPADAAKAESRVEPQVLTSRHTVSSVSPLTTQSALITWNSFTSPNSLAVVEIGTSSDAAKPPQVNITRVAQVVQDLAESHLLSRGEDFWFAGTADQEVHGFILFPPGMEDPKVRQAKKEKLPLAFLVHGGPQGCWSDSWSTRWNPNMFAARGYIAVAINPCGSTSYGQKFCDDIKADWGGRPFRDLVAGLEFVKSAYPEIDPSRTCLLGASYGGFMANWVAGHNDITKFNCIVNHDGVFNTRNVFYTTEELYFPERDFEGTPWTKSDTYSKWNPENHVSKWRTPMLLIHGGRDYRLTECESLAAFNVLQRLGVPSRLVYFGSENHWVLKPANSLKWHEEVFRWIDEWTAPSTKAQSSTEAGTARAGNAPGYDVRYRS